MNCELREALYDPEYELFLSLPHECEGCQAVIENGAVYCDRCMAIAELSEGGQKNPPTEEEIERWLAENNA